MPSFTSSLKDIGLEDIIKELDALPDVFTDSPPEEKHSSEYDRTEELADGLAQKGRELIEAKAHESAIPIMEEALERYVEAKSFSKAYDHIQSFYDILLNVYESKKAAGLPKAADIPYAKLRPLRKRSLDIANLKNAQNHVMDMNAYFVGVDEIGFSFDQPLGTAGLGGCVCVIVRDALTRKTAVAHVSSMADPQSLDTIFSIFPENSILKAKLLGAGIFDDSPPVFGHHNIEKIYRVLKKHHVRITHATLLKRNQPHQIIVYPDNFKVKEGFPGKMGENSLLNQGASGLGPWNRPLRVAFNLMLSQTISTPLYLDRDAVRKLKQITDRHYEMLPKAKRKPSYGTAPIEMYLSLREAYDAAHASLEETLGSAVENLRRKGITVYDHTIYWLKEALAECPVYVGKGAEITNRPLENVIKNGLFVANDKAANAMSRVLALFEFPNEHPHQILFKEFFGGGVHVRRALERLDYMQATQRLG